MVLLSPMKLINSKLLQRVKKKSRRQSAPVRCAHASPGQVCAFFSFWARCLSEWLILIFLFTIHSQREGCHCPCLSPFKVGRKATSRNPRAVQSRLRARVKGQILPTLRLIPEEELLRALKTEEGKRLFPRIAEAMQELRWQKQTLQLIENVKDVFVAGRHHKGYLQGALAFKLEKSYKEQVLGLTSSQAKASGRKAAHDAAVAHFSEGYPKGVHRQKISDLEYEGWIHCAETQLGQKSGPTKEVVWFLYESPSNFFWTKVVPNCWRVAEHCWKLEPTFECKPRGGHKETIFQRMMRVYKQRGKEATITPPCDSSVTPETCLDEEEVTDKLVAFHGVNTIICRSYVTVLSLITRDRGKKKGYVLFSPILLRDVPGSIFGR